MKRTALIIAVILAALAAPVVAQDEEITLASLAELITNLTGRVDAIEGRLTHGAHVDDDGNCRLAVSDRLHATSVVEYLEKYPDSDTPGRIAIASVYIVPGTGIAITFGPISESSTYRHITEYWSGCEFLNTSGWWATDWQGKRIDE